MALLLVSRIVAGPRCGPLQLRQIHPAPFTCRLQEQPWLQQLSRQLSAQPQPSRQEVGSEQQPAPFSPPITSHHHDNGIFSSPNTSKKPKIGRLVLVRHGQSEWNVTDPTRNLTARFTGWADIGLTQQGRDQAVAAGHAIQLAVEKGILPSKDVSSDNNIPAIDVVFCSLLKRSEDTMNIILEELNLAQRITPLPSMKETGYEKGSTSPKYQYPIPIIHSWRLNERHYGALVGLSKEGAERLYGKVRLTRWRDSWDVPPPPMPLEMVKRWGREDHCQPVTIVKRGDGGRTCVFDPASVGMQNVNGNKSASKNDRGDGTQSRLRIVEHGGTRKTSIPATNIAHDTTEDIDVTFMPPSESLRDTYERFLPLWIQGIAPHLRAGRTVLVVGHANTIRSMLFAIDGDIVTKENSKKVKIPSALPLVYEFVDRDGSGCLELTNKKASKKSTSANPIYTWNGRECSNVVPGNLRVLKPYVDNNAKEKGEKKQEVRHQLSGTWVETDETAAVSFCTELGQKMGEQDIA